jgi:hypothetical protein
MSMKLDRALAETGTKFNVFPQPKFLPSFQNPETIRISIPVNTVQPGPADDRMFVIDAIDKRPYEDGEVPPYNGPANPPVQAGTDGHFDHLAPGTRAFSAAHMYAVVRRVLDIWEDYFAHPIPWHFDPPFERLLLIPLVRWDNAQSGFGFLEFGFGRTPVGIDLLNPYCENFDVLAHEVGHSIIFSQVGVPDSQLTATAEYGGFHESAGDLTALVAVLHFKSVVKHLLEQSGGNLFTRNELERVGELSASDEIRSAFNGLRMGDVGDEPHDLSQPLTGALFDIFVEVFQKELVAAALITQALADRSFNDGNSPADDQQIQAEFRQAYERDKDGFEAALLRARDYFGQLLAKIWGRQSPNFLTYSKVAAAAFAADRELTNGKHEATIRACFVWRDISLLSNPIAAVPHRCLTPARRVSSRVRELAPAR